MTLPSPGLYSTRLAAIVSYIHIYQLINNTNVCICRCFDNMLTYLIHGADHSLV